MHLNQVEFIMLIYSLALAAAARHQVPELWLAHLTVKKGQRQTLVANANHAPIL
jgi:hypothetical protein